MPRATKKLTPVVSTGMGSIMSGTSLIAAHMNERIWRGVEMQLQWADLIVKRCEEATGLKDERAT